MIRTLSAACLLLCLPGLAQAQQIDRKVEDLATQPLSDVNLKRKDIPPELTAIMADLYDLTGLRKCRQIIAAVRTLDDVLGPDMDVAPPETKGEKRKQTALGFASGVVGSLIPFRFLIREVSGANKADQEYRAAIYAGAVRRGFLKGYGKARRCKPPGSPRVRPATP